MTAPAALKLSAIVLSDKTLAEIDAWRLTKGISDPDLRKANYPSDFSIFPGGSGQRILVLEAGDASPDLISAIEHTAQRFDEACAIIVIASNLQNAEMRRLFRAGVRDVLSAPAEAAELRHALDNTLAQFQPQPVSKAERSGRLFTVIKTAGGVGASTFAINLARELAHAKAGRIALIDMDVQFGSIDIALDLECRLNFTDAIRAGERLDATMVQSMMTTHKAGFDVLASGKSIAPVDVVTEAFVTRFVPELKQSHDFIIFDMPTAWGPWFYAAARESDVIFPVVEPTVRCADGARRITQAFDDLGLAGLPLMPVANRAEKTPDIKRRLKQISDILGAPCDMVIREDAKTAMQAADLGLCAREVSASAPLTADIEVIAQRLIAAPNVKTSERPAAELLQKLRFFGSRT